MATTTALAYFKPRTNATISESRNSSAVAYIPIRAVSGLYSTGVQGQNTRDKKNWRPHAMHPLGRTKSGEEVFIDPSWNRYQSYIGQKKLGGADFVTLPDVAQFITVAQANGLIASALAAQAAQQQANTNAQALATVVEVLKASGAAGAMQIPPVALAPAETTPPVLKLFEGSASAGGGGGD